MNFQAGRVGNECHMLPRVLYCAYSHHHLEQSMTQYDQIDQCCCLGDGVSKPFLHIFPLASETLSPEAAAATFDVRSGKFPPICQHNTRLALPTNRPSIIMAFIIMMVWNGLQNNSADLICTSFPIISGSICKYSHFQI